MNSEKLGILCTTIFFSIMVVAASSYFLIADKMEKDNEKQMIEAGYDQVWDKDALRVLWQKRGAVNP